MLRKVRGVGVVGQVLIEVRSQVVAMKSSSVSLVKLGFKINNKSKLSNHVLMSV